VLDTNALSAQLREASIDVSGRRLLVSRIAGSEQEADLSEPVNCEGLGRIRHFGRVTLPGWPENSLPAGPASLRLELPYEAVTRAQVFQNAACNWRCWYCYVPFNLLAAHASRSEWITPERLIDLWQKAPDPPLVLDLSGGQPDLVPEWVPWTMQALRERGLDKRTYLWSDDNLSGDYLWRYLDDAELSLLASYGNYGRAVCFKGIDEESFALNTSAEPRLYRQQFQLARRLIELGIDVYAYVTLTTTAEPRVLSGLLAQFMDSLQEVHELLPLRTVPLQITVFSPVVPRVREEHRLAMERQHLAVEAWNKELERRFSRSQRDLPLAAVGRL